MNHRTACILADVAVSVGCATMAIRDLMAGHAFLAGGLAVVAALNAGAAYLDFRFRPIRRPS